MTAEGERSWSDISGQPPVPPRRPSAVRRWLAAIGLPLWVITGFFLSQIVFVVVVAGLEAAGYSFEYLNKSIFDTITAAVVYLLTVAVVVGGPWLIRKARTTLKDLGLDRLPTWKDILLAPVAFVVYAFISSILAQLVVQLFPGFNVDQSQDVGFQDIHLQYEYILAFATLVIVAPVAEEVLMRGYLYGKLKRNIAVPAAMFITAVTFGLMHMQWNVGIDVFALSLVMTSLREVTGGIWSGILLHMMKNGLAFYLLFVNPSLLNTIGGS